MSPSDTITLRGVRATGFHGVFEHEKRDGQEFVVDVDLTLDLSRAGETDDLADTYDYGALAQTVVARIEGEPFDLVERLAAVIAQDAVRDVRVDSARVTVHKPKAPIPLPFDDVAVTVTRTRAPRPAVVALGANLPRDVDSPARTLASALTMLAGTPGVTDLRSSAVVDSEPVGGPADQPVFVNAVATLATTLSPSGLLRALHDVEDRFDRRREVRWGPRTLDLDLVQYGDPGDGTDVRSEDAGLTLPHPRAHERGFVLVPWLDVDPDATLRVGDQVLPVAGLVAHVDTTGVRPHHEPGDQQ